MLTVSDGQDRSILIELRNGIQRKRAQYMLFAREELANTRPELEIVSHAVRAAKILATVIGDINAHIAKYNRGN
ncbi:hypothetical protein UFOVP16_18 [uncultured Caudovirales phage]|uniref:Uncharacterized protein n=1 Tax=uncultured Caudovirales phage TaxID=2100421 RepID=A0A6J5KJQ7_9CAUD|nr:hypothetical protein UFOVP16_18 [uncultured Caudovirales phage]